MNDNRNARQKLFTGQTNQENIKSTTIQFAFN